MDEEFVETFVSFTGSTPEVARRYLGMTDRNVQQAIQLFFDSPDLASGVDRAAEPTVPPINQATRPQPQSTSAGREDSRGVAHAESDDDDNLMDVGSKSGIQAAGSGSSAAPPSMEYEDDEAIARRLQEELYAGGDMSGGYDADGVRAPLARTTETLVGGPDDGWGPGHGSMLAAMRTRRAAGEVLPPAAQTLILIRSRTARSI